MLVFEEGGKQAAFFVETERESTSSKFDESFVGKLSGLSL